MILVIDNYDSFTYNLVHYLGELGASTLVRRNDVLSAEAALHLGADAILLSPGPCTPNEAGICLEVLRQAPAALPILGVCLGHQAIAQAYGGRVARAQELMHGKTSPVRHEGGDLFEGVPSPFTAARYHSLATPRQDLPAELLVTAWSDDGEVMALRHRSRPVFGVQFHPESIATECGHTILGNFLRRAGLER